jgi:hypothetical protein
MYNFLYTGDKIIENSWFVADLVDTMIPWWDSANGDYPGIPYNNRIFPQYYSDHNPVMFEMSAPWDDD